MVRFVEEAFALSEAASTPAILQLRIRACHVRGRFACRDNVAPPVSAKHPLDEPAAFDYARLAHPPVTFRHEKLKVDERLPAARRRIVERGLNETFAGRARRPRHRRAGRPLQLARRARSACWGSPTRSARRRCRSSRSTSCIRWCPTRSSRSAQGKRAVLVVEEGQPGVRRGGDARDPAPRRRGDRRSRARDRCPPPASTRSRCSRRGSRHSSGGMRPSSTSAPAARGSPDCRARRDAVAKALAEPLPARPPQFCIGCPERPVFAAMKLAQGDDRAGARGRRHRLPFVRDVRAVPPGPLDPRLRDEPREPRRRVAGDAQAHAGDHGRRRVLAQRRGHRRAVGAVQRRRRGARHHEERLHVGDRHAGDPVDARRRREGGGRRQGREPRRRRTSVIERTLEGLGVRLDAHGATATASTRCARRSRKRSRPTTRASR